MPDMAAVSGAPGAGAPASVPPFGVSPATGPTPNRGYEAAGLQRLGSIVKQLEEMIPLLGAASDPGKACLDCLNKLVKFVPPGSVTPASDKIQVEQMLMRNIQNNPQIAALKSQAAPPGAPPPMPPAMPKVA